MSEQNSSSANPPDHDGYTSVDTGRPVKRRRLFKPRNMDTKIFDHWQQVGFHFQGKDKKKVNEYKCLYCEHTLTQSRANQLKHMVRAHDYDELTDTFDEMKINVQAEMKTIPTVNHSLNGTRLRIINKVDSDSLTQKNIEPHVIRMNQKDMEAGQKALSLWVIAKGIPFTAFADDLWTNFMDRICKPFVTPSPYQMSRKWLSEHYKDAMESTRAKLAGKMVTLGLDESKIGGKLTAVNFIALTPDAHFIESIFTGTDSLTTDYLTKLTLSVIARHKLNVKALISDNCSSVKKMRNDFESRWIDPHFNDGNKIRCLSIYCMSHGINLMIRDFVEFDFVGRRVKMVTSFCHRMNRNITLRRIYEPFAEAEGLEKNKKFNVPPEVRWLYYSDSLDALIKCRPAVQAMMYMKYPSVLKAINNNEMYAEMGGNPFWNDLIEVSENES